ncbi:unnamed protein product [Albugo candida]|uniref:Uncharacterized protein n=1 Tax=Albugo candida TaxID=65357 RepID=A0A024GI30_9STRA|nr:unnamed protein product [Albugo candida]|eukprot:CCI46395.1 unnamed protein product [Albugo candida]
MAAGLLTKASSAVRLQQLMGLRWLIRENIKDQYMIEVTKTRRHEEGVLEEILTVIHNITISIFPPFSEETFLSVRHFRHSHHEASSRYVFFHLKISTIYTILRTYVFHPCVHGSLRLAKYVFDNLKTLSVCLICEACNLFVITLTIRIA